MAATSFTARRKDPTRHTLRMRGAAQRTPHTREIVPTSLLAPGVWDTHSGRGLTPSWLPGYGTHTQGGGLTSLLAPGVWDTLPQGGGSRQ